MNNTFSFKRFKDLLLNDGKMYIRNYGTAMLVFCSLPIVFWISNLILGSESAAVSRGSLIYFIMILAMMLAPSKVYGHANLSREGVSFAMLPASSLEKFISMIVYCAIVTPLVAFIGSYLIDTLLSLFPFGGFDERIRVVTFNQLVDVLYNNGGAVGDSGYLISRGHALATFRISFYVGLLCWSAFFMLGNMIFKKHKAGRTFACLLGLGFILMIVSVVVLDFVFNTWTPVFKNYTEEQIVNMFRNGLTWMLVLHVAFTALLLFFTYRKIKTQKY